MKAPLLKLAVVVAFHLVMVALFGAIYRRIGFTESNFNAATPELMQTRFGPLYYSLQNQVHLAYGDVYSASPLARGLTSAQIAISYASLFFFMFVL